jgi:hypothetical protein
MPAENHPLLPRHWSKQDPNFPDIAVKDLRIDGDTLYALVANKGGVSARGPIKVMAVADAEGVRSEARPAILDRLNPGESRWVQLKQFSVKVASTRFTGPLFLLDRADHVVVAAQLPGAVPSALNRSGQGCDRCEDFNEGNNVLGADGPRVARGRPN